VRNQYNDKYNCETYYWGEKPSQICFEVLKLIPPDRELTLLDIGCGEGRNAVFFARNGYNVTAFDSSEKGLAKTRLLAEKAHVDLNIFKADLNEYRLDVNFDIIFSTGVLHYIPEKLRDKILSNYKDHTNHDGINAHSVLIHKPFIAKAPDAEATAHKFVSGEIFTHYHDWKIEYCMEEIFDCQSGGTPHKHAVNRLIARKYSL